MTNDNQRDSGRVQADVRRVADEIVQRLFTNGVNEEARRLVLELKDGRDGGGWSREAVRDQILDSLKTRST